MFNQPIEPGVLPTSLTELHLHWGNITRSLLPGALPSGLVKLTLSYNHDNFTFGVLDSSILPSTLTHLSLDNCRLSGSLPPSVVHFKARLRDAVEALNTSTTITHLRLDCAGEEEDEWYGRYEYYEDDEDDEEEEAFKVETCRIPASVTHLELYCYSLMMKPGFVPNSVTHLPFKGYCPVLEPGDIPTSVIDLHLVRYSGVLETGVIPSSVKTLYISAGECALCDGVIPASAETLILGRCEKTLSQGVIPSSVTKLVFLGSLTQLPSIPNSVVDLQCFLSEDDPVHVGAIPDSVKKFSFGCSDPSNPEFTAGPKRQLLVVGSIPSSVRELDMGPLYNAPIAAGIIPASVDQHCHMSGQTIQLAICQTNPQSFVLARRHESDNEAIAYHFHLSFLPIILVHSLPSRRAVCLVRRSHQCFGR